MELLRAALFRWILKLACSRVGILDSVKIFTHGYLGKWPDIDFSLALTSLHNPIHYKINFHYMSTHKT